MIEYSNIQTPECMYEITGVVRDKISNWKD